MGYKSCKIECKMNSKPYECPEQQTRDVIHNFDRYGQVRYIWTRSYGSMKTHWPVY